MCRATYLQLCPCCRKPFWSSWSWTGGHAVRCSTKQVIALFLEVQWTNSKNMSVVDINRSSLTSTGFWLIYFLKWYKCFLFLIVSSSLTSRAEFPLAIATMDAFGGGDLTISKLRDLCQKKQPKDWVVIFVSYNINCLLFNTLFYMNLTCDDAE